MKSSVLGALLTLGVFSPCSGQFYAPTSLNELIRNFRKIKIASPDSTGGVIKADNLVSVDLKTILNRHWNTDLKFQRGGVWITLTGNLQKDQKKAFLGIRVEGWSEPVWYDLMELYDRREKDPPSLVLGASTMTVRVEAGFFSVPKIVFKPIPSGMDSPYEVKVERLVEEVYKTGTEIRIKNRDYRLFYAQGCYKTQAGVEMCPEPQVVFVLRVRDKRNNQVLKSWFFDISKIPSGQSEKFILYQRDRVGLQLDPAAQILRINTKP
ncbi:MAG: hypothetical protein HY400_01100 [Elusimicrobia bacterium]|nr:hypothetical protein [Elusimicrobiota bacterium]